MSTVLSSPAAVHSNAIAWAAIGYVAGKEGRRDDLDAGAAHHVNLTLVGEIDGQQIEPVAIDGRLTIGHDSTRASSATPNLPQVVAAILAKLNPATREAVCRDLPADFAANGGTLPELSVGQVAQAEALLSGLRQSKQSTVRGSVKCEYALHGQPALSIVG